MNPSKVLLRHAAADPHCTCPDCVRRHEATQAPYPDSTPPAPLDLAAFVGFTPGPWSISPVLGQNSVPHVWGADGPLVASPGLTDADYAAARVEVDANLSLIAAAPALLAECRRLRGLAPPAPPALDRARRAELLAAELANAACQSHAPGALGESGRLHLLAAVQAWEAHRADLDTLDHAR